MKQPLRPLGFSPLISRVLALLFLSGCSTSLTPQNNLTPLIPEEIKATYRTDQEQRRQLSSSWQIQGILDIDHEEEGRRNRIEIESRPNSSLRFRIFGPFQQVAFHLLMDPQWLQLIKPDKREIIRVPATMAGMHYLTGYRLNPHHLYHFFMAKAAPLDGLPTLTAKGVQSTTQQGERLMIDPANGYLLERWQGASQSDSPYVGRYRWATPPLESAPPLPTELAITLPKESMTLRFILKKWHLHPADANAPPFAIPAGFSIIDSPQ
ncbi:MAG: hypothetical protein HQL72_06955 [Magnetococcales bacterium]|nr:hypothetical protein [Magnetococcales bacterium]